MKQLRILVGLMPVLLAAAFCGGCCEQKARLEIAPDSTLIIPEIDGFLIDSLGVGPVKLGMTLAEIPEAVEGLYDRVVNEHTGESLFSFYLGDDEVMTTGGFRSIGYLQVGPDVEPDVVTADGIRIGTREDEILKNEAWQQFDDGIYYNAGVTVYTADSAVIAFSIGGTEFLDKK
ncbi:MAG: hypothetical protein J1E63_08070 [Muribaculaceae bacterium]|nr:hypothetical protein [Muribaculaceae bacterium]